MREKLNSNPVVQAAVIGVLGIAVAFLVFTRVVSQGGAPAPDPATTTAQSATPAPTTPATSAPTDTAAPTAPDVAGVAQGSATTPSPGAAGDAAPAGAFEAGPGLPKNVVAAHNNDRAVVLLVVRGAASDDRRLKSTVDTLRDRPDTEVFVVKAVDIARYSRVAQGVDVNRTPALIVIEPKRLTQGELPRASVSYGYRGLASAAQQVNDALYEGKENLPFYP